MIIAICIGPSGLESSTTTSSASTSTWPSKRHEYEYLRFEYESQYLRFEYEYQSFLNLKKGNLTFSNRSYFFYANDFCLNSNPEKIN